MSNLLKKLQTENIIRNLKKKKKLKPVKTGIGYWSPYILKTVSYTKYVAKYYLYINRIL
jgi:hypothetical protein